MITMSGGRPRADQTLCLGLTLLNHQTRIAPTTTTNKIVSFIGAFQLEFA
jgi:hypothetical protein